LFPTSFFSLLDLSISTLQEVTERKGLDGGNDTIETRVREEVSCLGHLRGPLNDDLDSSLGSLGLCSLIGDLTGKNLLLTGGLTDVLDTYMNTLLDNPSIDHLVDTYSNSRLGDIENDTGTSVVMLVGHTLVDGWVGEDVDVVTNLYLHHVLGKMDGTMLTVSLGEHESGAGAGSEGVRHLDLLIG
jgi:hypothetical protein